MRPTTLLVLLLSAGCSNEAGNAGADAAALPSDAADPDADVPSPPDIDLTGYTLTFHDELDSLSVSTQSPKAPETWYFWPPYGAAGAYSASAWDVSAFSIDAGILSNEATLDPTTGQWKTGNLSSVDTTATGFSQTYGYFEIRAQMPDAGSGAWPAFWLDGTSGITPGHKSLEIDIFEWYGVGGPDVVQQASHNWNPDGTQGSGPTLYEPQTPIPGGNATTQFHIYGAMITPTTITWYIDGQMTNQIETPADYVSPSYVMSDYALGGGWPLTGVPASGSKLLVDWIRVYSLPPGT